MVSTYGTTVKCYKTLCIVVSSYRKFPLTIKTIIKQSRKNTTHMVLSLCNYFPLKIHCNERVSVLILCIQYATEKILWRGYRSVNTCYCTIHVTQAVNHIPTLYYLKIYSWKVVKMFVVLNVHSMVNTFNLWFLKCLYNI